MMPNGFRPIPESRSASPEIDYRTARGLDKSVIPSVTQQSAWVGTHENIFVLGPTGVGKGFVACALAQKACRDGYSALYTRAHRCSVILRWHEPAAVCAVCSRGSAASMSW